MIRRLVESLGACAVYPAVLAHEGTHVVCSRPWFEIDELRLGFPRPAVIGRWDADTPRWGILLGKLGPTLVGLLVGLCALVGWSYGLVGAPNGTGETLVLGLVAINWGIYAWPSADDRRLPHSLI